VERMDFYRPMVGLGDRPHRFYRAHPTCRWTNVMTMCTRPLQATDQQTTRPGGVGPARLAEIADYNSLYCSLLFLTLPGR
jgi:hypothetical protein